MIGFHDKKNENDAGIWNVKMKISNVNLATEFISRYGNVTSKADELLSSKPTNAQLESAKRACVLEVEHAFDLIKKYHGLT